MKSNQIFFFALKEDLIELVKSIESNFNIKCAHTGLLDEKIDCILSLQDVLKHHQVKFGDWNFNNSYLLIPYRCELQIREVAQRKGGIKYAIDQMKNEDSAVFSLGGEYDNAIVASKIGTISNTKFAKEFMLYISAYVKQYKNISNFYISSRAFEKAKKGVRLTTNTRQSTEYDLNIDKI